MAAVPTSQSEVTVMQSDNNQPRLDDESSQVERANGLYLCVIIAWMIKFAISQKYRYLGLVFAGPVAYTMLYIILEYLCSYSFYQTDFFATTYIPCSGFLSRGINNRVR